MRWPWRRREASPADASPSGTLPSPIEPAPFACSACGRTDLPPAGDWDPPMCLECDAAINEDALREADEWLEPW